MRASRLFSNLAPSVRRLLCATCVATLAICVALSSSNAIAGGGGGGGGGGAGGGGAGGGTTTFAQPIAGVDVDARGVLKMKRFDRGLHRQRMAAAKQNAGGDLMKPSKLRKVSLNRLEAELSRRLEAGESIQDDVKGLAGLTSVQYVFYYPESRDVVIAGPAEGFYTDASDRLTGVETGKPIVLLEDLIVAMRAYAPHSPPTDVISVSIDPTAEGLERLQRFMAQAGRNVQRPQTRWLAENLRNNLGLQTVSIRGIPSETHFARVLVEADYRMKLIGIGLEQLPVPVKSYVARANPVAASRNALQRWYFQPNYDGVSVSQDGLAMNIGNRAVELVGANERVAAGGERVATKGGNRASQAFCKDFTEKYSLIASKVRIYAEMQQLIDLAIAAAYIQEQDFYGQAQWDMPVFGNESAYQVNTWTAPEQVETAVNAIWKGNTLMTPLGGGVNVQPRLALSGDRVTLVSKNADAQKAAGPTNLNSGQWWWD